MAFAIYFLGFVGKIESIVGLVTLLIGLLLVLFGVITFCECFHSYCGMDNPDVKKYLQWLRRLGYVFAVCVGLFITIPSSKTIAAMYVIPAITQNEQLRHISENSLQALEQLTQKWIQDLMPKKE